MPLKMDLMKDYGGLLRQRLAAKGYPAPTSETDGETLTRYLNMLKRSIEPRPRVTKKAAGFTCPPDHQAGLDALIEVSEAGAISGRTKARAWRRTTTTTACSTPGDSTTSTWGPIRTRRFRDTSAELLRSSMPWLSIGIGTGPLIGIQKGPP
jgi:hypothetical protein